MMDEQASSPDTSAFPAETLTWLAGTGGRTVLVVGGSALATALRDRGNDVRLAAPGESPLPAADHTVDIVVAADTLPPDLLEVARVLRPGGHLALVVAERDRRIPWARKLDATIGAEVAEDPAAPLVASPLFGFVDDTTQRSWQVVNRESLAALLPTLPALRELEPAERDERISSALALYDDYGRGIDGMQLPWVLRCFRATVVENAYLPPRPPVPTTSATDHGTPSSATQVGATQDGATQDGATPDGAAPPGAAQDSNAQDSTSQRAEQPRGVPAEEFTFSADEFDDTGMLLIDFR